MKKLASLLLLLLAGLGYSRGQSVTPTPVAGGPFTTEELSRFRSLAPIDTHGHIYQSAPAFFAMMRKLDLHVMDILVVTTPGQKELDEQRRQAWDFVHSSHGRAALCSTFDPARFAEPGFASTAIAEINHDFADGAVAVKIWKTIGEQLKTANGTYLLPDDPVFEPVYRDIAAHHKTLVAHVADPDSIWQAPNPQSPDYSYYHNEHPEWYMYGRPNAPSKAQILRARDHLLQQNPMLRVVGAHLGSMEQDFPALAEDLDRYPNFAVDMAARMPYLAMQPRADAVRFITKYQDRLIYATDNNFTPEADPVKAAQHWESVYANDWRFLATQDAVEYKGRQTRGLDLPLPILRKIYHENAVKWFPGVVSAQGRGDN